MVGSTAGLMARPRFALAKQEADGLAGVDYPVPAARRYGKPVVSLSAT
jgi:hypothetical protein